MDKNDINRQLGEISQKIHSLLADLKNLRSVIDGCLVEDLTIKNQARQIFKEPIKFQSAVNLISIKLNIGQNKAIKIFKEWQYSGWIIKQGKEHSPYTLYHWVADDIKKEDQTEPHQELDFLL